MGLVQQYFHYIPELQLFIHESVEGSLEHSLKYKVATNPIREQQTMTGTQIYELVNPTERKHAFVHADMHPGRISVRRSLMKEVSFVGQRTGRDSIFLREAISHIGAHRNQMLFVKVPLSAYDARVDQDKIVSPPSERGKEKDKEKTRVDQDKEKGLSRQDEIVSPPSERGNEKDKEKTRVDQD